jgi:hypothetical protein
VNAGDYITQAVAQSYNNRPDVLADGGTELLVQLQLIFAKYYRLAAKQNPGALSAQAVLAWDTTISGWTIPATIDTTLRLELASSPDDEVIVVPLEDRRADPSAAAVIRLGRLYKPAGNANDPVNVNLVAYYAAVGPSFADLTTAPGTEWPVQFDGMIVAQLAGFLAKKDGRTDDARAALAEAGDWRTDFISWVQTPDLNVRRRFGMPMAIPTPAVAPTGVVQR